MKVFMLWAQRKVRYAGEYAPELLEAWSEYDVDDNPEGWAEAKDKAMAAMGSDLQSSVVVSAEIDGDMLDALLNAVPKTALTDLHEVI